MEAIRLLARGQKVVCAGGGGNESGGTCSKGEILRGYKYSLVWKEGYGTWVKVDVR